MASVSEDRKTKLHLQTSEQKDEVINMEHMITHLGQRKAENIFLLKMSDSWKRQTTQQIYWFGLSSEFCFRKINPEPNIYLNTPNSNYMSHSFGIRKITDMLNILKIFNIP